MAVTVPYSLLLVGFGATNQAVARGLTTRGHRVVATDDGPSAGVVDAARVLGVELVERPDTTTLAGLVRGAGAVLPSPGLPDGHSIFALAADLGVPFFTEFDLAQAWDDRPVVAITGTDGKTTVTTMVTAMLRASGLRTVDAGNNDLPLVAAIDDPAVEIFVVEASSFRLGRTHAWAPTVATWLNFADDHLDIHATLSDYEAAKARLWSAQGPGEVAIGNADDPVVAGHLDAAPARRLRFSITGADADYRLDGDHLVGPDGPIIAVSELPRALPHDLANALASSATAMAAGATVDAVTDVLATFGPLPHRVFPVATIGGVTWYDDSKATAPHATLAAIRGFDSVVLIAGGRNKGLDLSELAGGADHIRAVVAIGDAAAEVVAAFEGLRPTVVATSMADAVDAAARLAEPGDAVVLSPACASFDWYPDYAARGDDFAGHVRAREESV